MPDSRCRWMLALALAVCPACLCWSQADQADRAEQPGEGGVTIGERGSAQDPLSGREPAVSAEPTHRPERVTPEAPLDLPSLGIKLDERVLGVAPGDSLPPLRREGEALRRRDGRLLPTGERGYAVFIAEADPAAGDEEPVAMVLSPCMTLEAMERLQEDRGEDLRFTVTGIVHTYRGVNYLLPTSQPRPWLVEDGPPDQTVATDRPADNPEGGEAVGGTDPTPDEQASDTERREQADAPDTPEDSETPDDERATPTADEVLEDLLQQRDDTPRTDTDTASDKPARGAAPGSERKDEPTNLPPADGSGDLTDPLLLGLDPDQPQAELKPEGEFMVARAGRLVRSANGSHALFVLDADQRSAPEPPMILHACKLLETMEQTVMKEGGDVPFVVTGQVFVYRGANYLLPTIVTREFDRGNLE